MKAEMKFAHDSSTTLPWNDPLFRIQVSGKKRRDKTAEEFAISLKALFGKRKGKKTITLDRFKNSLANVLKQNAWNLVIISIMNSINFCNFIFESSYLRLFEFYCNVLLLHEMTFYHDQIEPLLLLLINTYSWVLNCLAVLLLSILCHLFVC